ncbi:hypothetical protein DEM27_28790 [Metarhizobium album]|uniref:DUF6894 domain-containing protein n=1 Tax=Metarhizobium album TaxID=2182425 RepID=A0A2U2DHM8_9HYPH|nr:hypothetical protein [Rhizobium album]PWE52802.1 hypothetical protein DEM27_28790 [Rhizobium album]
MARYYFDIVNGDGDYRDEEGVDLPDNSAAKDELARTLGSVVREALIKERKGRIVIAVRNDSGLSKIRGTLDFAIETDRS